ncbi:tetratricopeptide repeat protein [Actinoplanes utahensis]|uniref:Uncharacterized protein n=1 Tax=Actinoplanes utahensis TaxID=1869 RepID=A0A0A6UCX3_ACTUT|nr:tetratricopeptide repeat protein [Actinoplanes utahensis]KHD73306.1 hypothetical protein MB27_35815 [Actinoplanes utahensis]GIF27402.1 hypothetical protein Aut01nite_03880 [Actinoplanes utahensis]
MPLSDSEPLDDPKAVVSWADLTACMSRRHIRAGKPSTRALEAWGKQRVREGDRAAALPRSTVSDVLRGRPPKKPILLALVRACGETDPAVLREWAAAWDRAALTGPAANVPPRPVPESKGDVRAAARNAVIFEAAEKLRTDGHIEAALDLHRNILQWREKDLGPHEPDTLHSLVAVARCHHAAKRWAECRDAAQEAVARCHRAHGEAAVESRAALNLYGTALNGLKDYASAVEQFARALELEKTAAPMGSGETAKYAANLASARLAHGDVDGAIEAAREVLTSSAAGDLTDRQVRRARLTLISALQKQGKADETLGLHRAELAYLQATSNLDGACSRLIMITEILRGRGENDAAATMGERALQAFIAGLGMRFAASLEDMRILADKLRYQDDLFDTSPTSRLSFPLFEVLVDINRLLFGDKEERTLEVLADYGEALLETTVEKRAMPVLREVVDGYSATVGDEDERTLGAMSNAIRVLEKNDEFAEAYRLARRQLSVARVKPELDSADQFYDLATVARLAQKMGEAEEASNLYDELERTALREKRTGYAMRALLGKAKLADNPQPVIDRAVDVVQQHRIDSMGLDELIELADMAVGAGRTDVARTLYLAARTVAESRSYERDKTVAAIDEKLAALGSAPSAER